MAAFSDHSSLMYPQPELSVVHCPAVTVTSMTVKEEVMWWYDPVVLVAQRVRLSVKTQHNLSEDSEPYWSLQMLTAGHPICSCFKHWTPISHSLKSKSKYCIAWAIFLLSESSPLPLAQNLRNGAILFFWWHEENFWLRLTLPNSSFVYKL